MSYDSWIQNAPISVRLAGWQSDTYTLQQHGWQISASQRMDIMALQIALRLPGDRGQDTYCVSNMVDMQYWRSGQDRLEMLKHLEINIPYSGANVALRVDQPGRTYRMVGDLRAHAETFYPVDATPHYVDLDKDHKLEDMVVFRPLPKDELIVAPDTVPGLMDKILALQDPKMKELLQEQRKREARNGARDGADAPKLQNHCSIISIAS